MNKASDRIVISQLCKSFAKHKVLRELDWSIAAGAVVGLLGTNGAGKTTLLQCLLGLLKADSGRVVIDGEDSWDLSTRTKARIGYVDQRPKFYPWMKGKQLLSTPSRDFETETEYATMRAQLAEANKKRALLQKEIEALQIRSNIDGVVATSQVKQNLLDRLFRRGDVLVEIQSSESGAQFRGEFQHFSGFALNGVDTIPGTLQLKWSRLERRFNGTWGKGADRTGTMSLRLVDKEIRGGWTTDEGAQLESGTPLLGDLLWTRNASKTQAAESPGVSIGLQHDRLIQRLQGRWQVVRVVDPEGADSRLRSEPDVVHHIGSKGDRRRYAGTSCLQLRGDRYGR